LFGEFEKYARYDGEAMNFCDKNLLSYLKQGGGKKGSLTGRPEIDRPRLRELLYNSLAENTVRWSHKLTQVDDDLTMRFANGRKETGFDLIVGADGAFSKVRPILSDAQPFYSGIGGHAFRIPEAESKHPELYDLVNRGSLFSWSDSKSIMAQYMGDGSINIGTWSVRPEDWQKQYDVHDAETVKTMCRKEYEDWDQRLVDFTQKAEGAIVPRDLYMLPVGHKWKHVRGVTLVGDAAHLMTP
jgi:2-polyprenyl-6-methoxyphenol hydroxylase-like FAD-dependent oxidoreductase